MLSALLWFIITFVQVTGSANGLGRDICKELVKYKPKLVLWDVSESENNLTAEELRSLGAEHVYADTVDVSDMKQVALAAEKVKWLKWRKEWVFFACCV